VFRVVLPAAQPYSFALSLRAMAGYPPHAGGQDLRDDRVRQVFTLDDGTNVVAEVCAAPGGVALTGHGVRDGGHGEELALAVRRWLSLDDDPGPFLALARRDAVLAPVLAETEGLHQVRFPGLAAGACYFVLAQRTAQRQAMSRARRLAAALGPEPIVLDGVEHQPFPTLDRVAGCAPDELAGFTATGRQAEYLHAVAERLAEWPPGHGYRPPTGELLAELRAIRGVGEFTARAIALRVLGRLDVVPATLPAFTRAITALYGPDDDPAARYGEHAGLWGYHVRTGLAWLREAGALPGR
jgi:DNA-3-methyladenine glycosylase II